MRRSSREQYRYKCSRSLFCGPKSLRDLRTYLRAQLLCPAEARLLPQRSITMSCRWFGHSTSPLPPSTPAAPHPLLYLHIWVLGPAMLGSVQGTPRLFPLVTWCGGSLPGLICLSILFGEVQNFGAFFTWVAYILLFTYECPYAFTPQVLARYAT